MAISHLVWQPPDAGHHSGHHVHPCDLVLINQFQRVFSVKLGHPHDITAAEQGVVGQGERGVVIKRTWVEDDAVGGNAESARLVGVGQSRCVVNYDFQAAPSRAARRHCLPVAGNDVGKRVFAASQGAEFRRQRSDRRSKRWVWHGGQPRPRQVKDGVQFNRRQAPGNDMRCGAQFPQSERKLVKSGAVGKAEGDEVIFDHSGRLERPCSPRRSAIKLALADDVLSVP